MSEKALQQNIYQLLEAIDTCLEKRFITPALVLVYSGIDTLAWLDRRHAEPDVTGSDFVTWVDTYMLPDKRIQCTSADLYGARCGLVHTFSPLSSRSRSGAAKEIYYSWGTARMENLQLNIDLEFGKEQKVAIHIDSLVEALRDAIRAFYEELGGNPEWQAKVFDRAGKCFIHVPTEYLPGAA